ncbi:MAG: hypothetical protein U9O65_10235 [Thermotogota bacterium]|nr:hypothetical protein [Thermotogota bacterium]
MKDKKGMKGIRLFFELIYFPVIFALLFMLIGGFIIGLWLSIIGLFGIILMIYLRYKMYKKIADELYSDETVDSGGTKEVSEASNNDIEKGEDE